MDRYEIIIFWSDEDQAFVADVPELPGCMAHGATHDEVLREYPDLEREDVEQALAYAAWLTQEEVIIA